MVRTKMTRTIMIAAALAAVGAANAAVDDAVRIDTGMVSGIASATPDVRVFKGIPYAAPPTGDQRWRAPKPAAHWDGIRKADTFSPVCMQGADGAAKTASTSTSGPAPKQSNT